MHIKPVYPNDMWGFLEVDGFVFGNRSKLVNDPSEEKLKVLFDGVKGSYILLNTVIRIDEVEQEGVPQITKTKGAVAAFPVQSIPKN